MGQWGGEALKIKAFAIPRSIKKRPSYKDPGRKIGSWEVACTSDKERTLPAPDTLPSLLLTLTALSGEFPTAQVNRLPGADSYKAFAVKRLKREKLLHTYYRDGLRGLRLTGAAKRLLLAQAPDRFLPLLSGDTATNAPKYTIPHRLRLHRMAEVLVTMHNTGISSFPWEKPAVFQPILPGADSAIVCPVYYSSREVKEIGPQAAQIRGSRATGLLLTEGGIFVVYNTGSGQMKWEYKAELRLKALLQTEVCQYRLPKQFQSTGLRALVFGDGMGPLELFMGAGDSKTKNYFVLDGSYEHFYYLTNDRRGEFSLRLLCDADLKAALDEILSEDLSEGRPDWSVENDALDGNGAPVLFAYSCDMPRIRRFDAALDLHGLMGTLICFDFQLEALRRVCGPRVRFQSINFEALERSVVYPQKEFN